MEIDNFKIFREHLTFREKTDRYIVHILRRPKDLAVDPVMKAIGSNEHQRLLRTYYIDSLEYFDTKIPAIKELCATNKARAYILPQVRNNYECLLSLGEKVLETIRLGNFSAKPEHLLRSAYCEYHKSRDKKWILDLDKNEMAETWIDVRYGGKRLCKREWTLEEVQALVKKYLREAGKSEDEMYTVSTKNGNHIITSPFNLAAAKSECGLLYEGVQKRPVELEKYQLKPGDKGYAGSIGLDSRCREITKDAVGWLHKDGMSLLYLNLPD